MDCTAVVNLVIFILVLAASLGIGIFFSFKQKSTTEYIHGGFNMSIFPVAISLVVTFLSAVTMQGVPAEVYMFGTDISFILISIMIGIGLVPLTFLPIFFNLRLDSVYEYLERRYQSKIPKLLGCSLDIFHHILYVGILYYGTGIALESLIGVPIFWNITAMVVVCTIYTSIGGLQGVIWNDLFQGVIMIGGIFMVIVGANVSPSDIWHELQKYGKTQINTNPSISQRSNVWIFTILFAIRTYISFCDQVAMMRYTGLSTFKKANISLLIGSLFFVLLQGLGITLGAVVFAYYAKIGCGPLAARKITSPNAIVPYFVTEIVQWPGFVGLFAAATLSGTLSTASSSLNAIAVLFLEDFIIPRFPGILDSKKTLLLKLFVAFFGILMGFVAFLASFAKGTVFQVSNAVHGIIKAPAFGMFALGATFTFVGLTPALIGCIVGMFILAWLFIGKLMMGTNWSKPSLVAWSCNTLMNVTSSNFTYVNNVPLIDTMNSTTGVVSEEISNFVYYSREIYGLSPYAYHFVGLLIAYSIGMVLSLIPAFANKNDVSPDLVFPFVRKISRHLKSKRDEVRDALPENDEVTKKELIIKEDKLKNSENSTEV